MKYIIAKTVKPFNLVRILKGNKLVRTLDLNKAYGQYSTKTKIQYIDVKTGKIKTIELPERIEIFRG